MSSIDDKFCSFAKKVRIKAKLHRKVFILMDKEERMKNAYGYLLVAILIFLVFGCCKKRACTSSNGTISGENKRHNPYKKEFKLKSHTGKLLSDEIKGAVIKAGKTPMNLLVLSGGGQNGAYGAGFLNGLADRPNRPKLTFNIVTGVSTGALQATYAYLGVDYYKYLKEAYLSVSQKDIFEDRSLFDLLCASSFKDTAPLRSLVKNKYITKDIIKEVAEVYEKTGNLLYIGTVDLDTGEFIPWNMGEIAKEGSEEAYQLYWDVIMASAAYPVFFPPVLIEKGTCSGVVYENLQADGGTRENVFLRQFMIDFINGVEKAVEQADPSIEIAQLDESNMTVILNDKIGLGNKCVDHRLIDVGLRSLSALLDQSTVNAVFRTYVLACVNSISFRMTRIPDDAVIDESSLEFNPKTMKELYELGYENATETPIPWETIPPTGEDINAWCSEKH
jgi:hypothetical protein